MKKIIIFIIICAIFLAGFVSISALELGLSPSKMNLNGSTGEKICGNFTLSTSAKALDLSVEDKWTDKAGSKNLNDYTKPASDYKIESDYVEEINLGGKKKFEFCIIPQKPGIYNGVLIFRSKTIAGLGMWVNAEIGGIDLEKSSIPITGASVGESGIKKYLWPLLISTLVSLIALIFLIKYSKKVKKNKEEKNEEDEENGGKSEEKSDWDDEEEDED